MHAPALAIPILAIGGDRNGFWSRLRRYRILSVVLRTVGIDSCSMHGLMVERNRILRAARVVPTSSNFH